METKMTRGSLTVTIEEGELAGRTYRMGGEGLVNPHGFWVHLDSLRQIKPIEKEIKDTTEEERVKVAEAIKEHYKRESRFKTKSKHKQYARIKKR